MKYPKEVQEYVDFLSSYKENDELKEFDIFHLYPKEIAFPNGCYDSRFFDLVGFNTKKHEKKCLGSKDGVNFYSCSNKDIDVLRIFADGSTLVKFRTPHKVGRGNSAGIL